jgi:hypothetical protein
MIGEPEHIWKLIFGKEIERDLLQGKRGTLHHEISVIFVTPGIVLVPCNFISVFPFSHIEVVRCVVGEEKRHRKRRRRRVCDCRFFRKKFQNFLLNIRKNRRSLFGAEHT